jgi:hypothetical protein
VKLLDTTFLAHYYRGDPRVESYLSDHDADADGRLITSTINLKEIAVGVHVIESDPTKADVAADFEWVDVVPFTADDAYHAGAIEARLQQADDVDQERLNALAGDILIAGVAVNYDATVVTDNVDDFERLDVSVEAY